MKKKLRYVATLSMALLFTACGGDSSSPDNQDEQMTTSRLNDVTMKIGTHYNINKGDTIVKVSKTPKIELETNTTTGKTTAQLLDGEAKIKKGSQTPSF